AARGEGRGASKRHKPPRFASRLWAGISPPRPGTLPAVRPSTLYGGEPMRVLFASIVCLLAAVASAGPLTIMPMGDSITYGYGDPGGYRAQLYTDLSAA